MKTFSLIWSIFVIALILFVCALQIIDYRKTKDDRTISPEDLRELRKRYLRVVLILGAILLLDHVERLVN